MKTIQIGLEWFPERAGGLPRYFFDLVNTAPHLTDARGMVLGSANVAGETVGRIRSYAASSDSYPRKIRGARRTYAELLSEETPELTVSHFAPSTLPVLDLIKGPMAVHFHGPWAGEGAVEGDAGVRVGLKRLVERAVYRRGGLFIVLSQAFAEVLHVAYGVPRERIRVIPGGVDVKRFDIAETRIEARERLGWPTDRPILLAVRRLVRRMGLEYLIEAMTDVVRPHPDALLMIAGRGPLRDELLAQIEARGLERNVRLLGFVSDEDLPRAYRAADLSVVSTQALEGFGLIAVESLAAGTPAIVTPVGGLPEVSAPLAPALVFEGKGAEAIAAGLVNALSGRGIPDAAACRNYAATFDWPIIAARVTAAYREAASS
jgi:glycosyltransferase involved in cell wall biosynthesis